MTKVFSGDKKQGKSLLYRFENKLKNILVPLVPSFIQTYHLTYTTIVWTLLNIYVGLSYSGGLAILWLVNLAIVGQYITDVLDGEIGRRRNTGLIKWGFYMDHFLDYIFLSSIVFVGYMISPVGLELWYFGLVVVLGSYMVNSFLSFAATNKFQISYFGIGPTESRIVFIIINVYIMYAGTSYFTYIIPSIFIICLIGLIVNTYMIQKNLWSIDMKEKQKLK